MADPRDPNKPIVRTAKGYISEAKYTPEERAEVRRQNVYNNPAMTQHSRSMNSLAKLAAQLNWQRRALMGLTAQVNNSFFWVYRDTELADLSLERKQALFDIEVMAESVKKTAQELVDFIDSFKTLPKWKPGTEDKHLKPSMRKKKGKQS